MTYQPPLIGSKQLLNINATSLPHIGFYISLISMAIAGSIWWKSEGDGADDGNNKSQQNVHSKAA